MKRFVYTILLFITIPLILLVGIYLWTDPFRCIHDFDIENIDDTNREHLSTELFLRNESIYDYNSFIFASSRGGGMNTYQWKQYLPDDAQPFLFQAWSETVTGIELKMAYLCEHQIPMDNALLLIDVPGTFAKDQLPHEALTIKHYIFTGRTKFCYNVIQFWNFIQKPTLWYSSIRNKIQDVHIPCPSDTITNDWDKSNRYHFTEVPSQDSLKSCSSIGRRTFLEKINHSGYKIEVSKPLIDNRFLEQLHHIHSMLVEKQTDYHIIITPAPCYTNPAINPQDISILQNVFGQDRVHDYSGKNEITEDYNNFSDPGHFGLRVGFMIIEDIYR